MADYTVEVSIPSVGPATGTVAWQDILQNPQSEIGGALYTATTAAQARGAIGLISQTSRRSPSKNIVNSYRANVVSNNGSVSAHHLNALSDALDLLTASSAWPKIKELWIPLGDNLASALVKLKYPSALSATLTHDNLVEADYSPSVGITGGTNKRIKSDFSPSTHIATNDAGIGVFVMSDSWPDGSVIAGSTSGTSYYLNFQQATSKLGTYTTPSAQHLPGRALQWGQFRNGKVEFGTAGRITFDDTAAPSAMSGALSLFSANNSFFSNITTGGYALFEAMSPNELLQLDAFFKHLNSFVGRDAYAPTTLFVGDSITAGLGASSTSARWVNVFAERYNLGISNQGISGATLKAPPYPGFAVYPLTQRIYNKPSVFYVIFIGTNDAYNFAAPSTHLQDFEASYRALLNSLISDGINLKSQVLLVSPSWPSDAALTNGVTRARYESYVQKVSELALEFGVGFVNAYEAVLNAGGTAALSDLIHPNDIGHAAIANAVGAAFESRTAPQIQQAL